LLSTFNLYRYIEDAGRRRRRGRDDAFDGVAAAAAEVGTVLCLSRRVGIFE
jgi:hypothetical protein